MENKNAILDRSFLKQLYRNHDRTVPIFIQNISLICNSDSWTKNHTKSELLGSQEVSDIFTGGGCFKRDFLYFANKISNV